MTGDFEKIASKIIQNEMEMREHADYEDFFVASKKGAEEQISFVFRMDRWRYR